MWCAEGFAGWAGERGVCGAGDGDVEACAIVVDCVFVSMLVRSSIQFGL